MSQQYDLEVVKGELIMTITMTGPLAEKMGGPPQKLLLRPIDAEHFHIKMGAGAEGLVTTEKDWVRLRDVPRPRRPIHVVSVRLQIGDGAAAWERVFEKACAER